MSSSLASSVPAVLREPLDEYDSVLPVILQGRLNDMGIDDAAGFMIGALDHQYRVHNEHSKVFRGTLQRVELFERKSGDFVLGKKARIYFTSQSTRGGEEEQHIDTDWVEFNGYDGWREAWALSLSNTILRIAKDNIGNECLIRKAFIEAQTSSGGDRVRFIADIKPIKRSTSSTSSTRSGSSDTELDRSDDRDTFIDKMGAQSTSLSVEDIEEIQEIIDEFDDLDDLDGMAQEISRVFEISLRLVTKAIESEDKNAALARLMHRAFPPKED